MRKLKLVAVVSLMLSALIFASSTSTLLGAHRNAHKLLVSPTVKAADSENGPRIGAETSGLSAQGGAFRSIVGRLPQNVRAQFLQSLMFKDGRLATAYIGGIKSGLPPNQYGQVLMALGVNEGGKDYEGYECSKTATCSAKKDCICISTNCIVIKTSVLLGSVLAQVSAIDRNRFLDSLDFAGGRLVSANVGSVRGRLSTPALEQLFSGLGVSPAEIKRTTGDYISR